MKLSILLSAVFFVAVATSCGNSSQQTTQSEPAKSGPDFVVGNLAYTITDAANRYVSVRKAETTPSGNVILPHEIENEGTTYTLTEIPAHAFEWCKNISKIGIPSSVTSVGESAFGNCGKEIEIYCEANAQPAQWNAQWNADGANVSWQCALDENFIYADAARTTIVVYGGNAEQLTIPSSVTTINANAFVDCDDVLKLVRIRKTVTNIAEDAFRNCYYTEMYCEAKKKPAGYANGWCDCGICVWECEIDDNYIFADAAKTTITTYTGEGGDVVIPNNVSKLDNDAFYNCDKITSVTIPASVTSIGDRSFCRCKNLKSINVENGNKNYVSIDGVLYSADRKTLLFYPEGKDTSFDIPDFVENISDCAFEGNATLRSVNIPSSVKKVGSSPFHDCYSLTYNHFDNAKYLGNRENPYLILMAADTTAITSCEIHANCQIIYRSAFFTCRKIASLNIPKSIKNIGFNAFVGVKNIVYSGKATDNEQWGALTVNGTFDGDFIYADAAKTKLTAYNGQGGDVVIPQSVKTIGEYAFYEGENITSVTIPSSVTAIDMWAFYACKKLTTIDIPASVTAIGKYAFYACTELKKATVGNPKASVGENAFVGCNDDFKLEQ